MTLNHNSWGHFTTSIPGIFTSSRNFLTLSSVFFRRYVWRYRSACARESIIIWTEQPRTDRGERGLARSLAAHPWEGGKEGKRRPKRDICHSAANIESRSALCTRDIHKIGIALYISEFN